jgi:hypothetical protein
MRRIVNGLVALALLGTWSATAQADLISFDTVPEWDGVTSVAAWGSVQSGFSPTFGQTFLAPSGPNSLLSFSFFLTDFTPGDTLTYQAAVFSWSGSLLGGNPPQGATGSPVFLSAPRTFIDTGNFQEVLINTGGVDLTPGGAYVALLTTTGGSSGSALGLYQFGLTGFFAHQSNNGGGGFVFNDNPDFYQLNTAPWSTSDDFGDLAWRAEFRPVPEPSALVLFCLGSSWVLGYKWRRRPQDR